MAAEPSRTVFINTTLGTRFLMRLSPHDTVSHFKCEIEKEHALNFPDSGEIVVRALEIKRKGVLYRLLNSVVVQEAFNENNKNWFLHVDASPVVKKHDDQMHIENISPDNPLLCPVASVADKSVAPSDHSLKQVQDAPLEEASQPKQTLKKKRKAEQIVKKDRSQSQEKEVDADNDAFPVGKERVEIGVVGDNNLGTTSVPDARENKRRKKSKDKVANEALPSGLPPHTTSVLEEARDGVSMPKPKEQESSTVVSKVNQRPGAPEDNSSLIVKEPKKLRMPIEVPIHEDTVRGQVETEVQTSDMNVAPNLTVQSEAIEAIGSQKKKRRSQENKQGPQTNVSIEPLPDSGVESNRPRIVSAEEDSGVIGTEVRNSQKTTDNVAKVGNGEEESVEKKRETKQKSSAKVGKSSAKKLPGGQAKVGKSSAKKNNLVVSSQEIEEGPPTNVSIEPLPGSGVQASREESNLPPLNTNKVPRLNTDSTVSVKEDTGVIGTEVTSNQKTTDNEAQKKGNEEEESVEKKGKAKPKSSAKVGKSSAKKLPDAQAKVKKSLAKKNSLVMSSQEIEEGPRINVSIEPLPDSSVQTGREENNLPPPNTSKIRRMNTDSTVSVKGDAGVIGTEVTSNQKTTDNVAKIGNGEEESVEKKGKTKQKSSAKVGKSSAKKLPNAQAKVGDAQKMEFATVSNSGTGKRKTTIGETAASDKLQSGIISNPVFSTPKVSSKDDGATKQSLEPKKKLTTMSGSIFKDDSEGSSESEGTKSSRSSTTEPSDYSSDYSDGTSKTKASQIGSQTSTLSKSMDGKSIAKPRSEKVFLDSVLRSSSRFKKAKTTAQLEEESQPVDAVPDSEPAV